MLTYRLKSTSPCIACAGLWIVICASQLRAAPIESNPTPHKEASTDRRPQEIIDAIKRFESGNADGAFELLKTAAAQHPQLAPARVMLANLYLSDNQRAAGLKQLELAVVENPDDPEAHLIFGDIALFERRLSDAAVQFDAGRSLLAKYTADADRKAALTAQCYLGLAHVAELRGQWDSAQKQISQLLELQPHNTVARQRLAETLVAVGKTDEGLAQLQAAVQADSKLPPAPSLMADIFQRLGKPADVEKWLRLATKEAPGDLRPRVSLGRWLLSEGEIEQAANEFAAAEKLDPKSIDAKLGIGACARYLHDDAKARKYLQDVLEQSPGNFLASDQLALVLADQSTAEDLKRSLELALANAHSSPQSSEAEATLGYVYYRMGKLDDAAQHLRASAHGSISRDSAYFMARVALDQGNRDDGARLLRQAIDGKGPFAHATDATRLLGQLTKPTEAPSK